MPFRAQVLTIPFMRLISIFYTVSPPCAVSFYVKKTRGADVRDVC
jgi:hypothetical protein